MARPTGQLERSLASLTIGMAQGQKARVTALADTVSGEYLQQLRVPISGGATDVWASVDKPIQWEMPFLYAPLQRRVPFVTPHFNYGIEMVSGQGTLVVVHAHVVGWIVTEQQWYVGATVRFAAVAPTVTGDPVPWSGIGHLSFQGYATMAEGNEFAQ